jgi:hypothetical protein
MSEISPIKPVDDYYQPPNPFRGLSEIIRNPVDTKIQDVVLSRISRPAPSTLLGSVISPDIVIDLVPAISILPGMEEETIFESVKQRKKGRKTLGRAWPIKYIPIGLSPCVAFPPLNAILQFILFLPSFRDIFSFIPRSFTLLVDFLDQYAHDQKNNELVSSADSNQLFRLLYEKMPSTFFPLASGEFEAKEFLFALVKAIFGKMPPLSHSLPFHPEWHAVWDVSLPFSCAVDLPSRPLEMLLTFKNGGPFPEISSAELATRRLIQRQFFTQPDSYCYDLDAFIEYRPDGKSSRGIYVSYLKNEGIWYQCDDERITPLRSNHLNMPLYRSVLLHYKRIWPT